MIIDNVSKAVLNELEKQIICPGSVLKLRIVLHYNLDEEYLWSKVHYAIKSLIEKDGIIRYRKWLTLKIYEKEKYIDELYQIKQNVRKRWITAASKGGYYFEKLVKGYFDDRGIETRPKTIEWNGKKIRIDLFNPRFAIEVKNVFSDMFYNPETTKKQNEDHKQIRRFFDYCYNTNITPILISPLIDNSFYKFSKEHNGLFCRTFTQIIKPEEEKLVEEIKDNFLIGNVRAVQKLPDEIAEWLDKNVIEKFD